MARLVHRRLALVVIRHGDVGRRAGLALHPSLTQTDAATGPPPPPTLDGSVHFPRVLSARFVWE